MDGVARERGQINGGRLPRARRRAGGTGFAWPAAAPGVQPATVPIASPLAGTVNRHIRSWLVPVGAITILVVGAGMLLDDRPDGVALPVSFAVLMLASACWAVGLSERVRDPRLVVSALVGLGLCGAGLDWPQSDGPGLVVGFMALAGLALRVPRLIAMLAAMPVVVAIAVSDAHEAVNPASTVLTIALGAAFLFVTSALAALSRDGQHRAEALLAQEATIREVREQNAALAERSRLARELHDILAHCLSGLSVQLEGAQLRAAQTAADAVLAEQIACARELARDGMLNTRRAVRALRGDELPEAARLPQLVSDTASALGVPVTVRVDGPPRALAPEAALTAYRTVQEALTNVAKHAGRGATASIVLTWAQDSLDISVADQGGERRAAAGTPGGFGLAGMAERAALHGGHVEAGHSGDGFTVRLRLPVRPAPQGERT
ncbi:MAG TPA: histidine kinase [Streptosporangiaceae bacterium]|nr:histidine kinase [Streptosporangiaceae bacterium]